MTQARSSMPPVAHRVAKLDSHNHAAFSRTAPAAALFKVEVVAAIFAVIKDEPVICVVKNQNGEKGRQLPAEAFDPAQQQSLDEALRDGVIQETGLELGYIDQLGAGCATTDCEKAEEMSDEPAHLSVCYLALAHGEDLAASRPSSWQSWYGYFPWEDWRRGKPAMLSGELEPALSAWAQAEGNAEVSQTRHDRLRMFFGIGGGGWDEEKVLERYDMLEESGILTKLEETEEPDLLLRRDHRRCLATAMGRLRAKIKYRPVVFDLMPALFTLFELQRTVEAILGPHLHKQNFRRLVEHMGLVEPTMEVKTHTGGRPAKLFRFRQSVVLERMQPGVRVRSARS